LGGDHRLHPVIFAAAEQQWDVEIDLSILENNCMQSTASRAGYSPAARWSGHLRPAMIRRAPHEFLGAVR
jgi:hypothetical protein